MFQQHEQAAARIREEQLFPKEECEDQESYEHIPKYFTVGSVAKEEVSPKRSILMEIIASKGIGTFKERDRELM